MSVAERATESAARRPHRTASLRLLRSELRLIVVRRRNQAGILVLASVPVLIAVALKFSQPKAGRGPDFLSSATSNGIFVALAALSIELALFLPLAVAVLSGDAIAGEANLGTLRYLLTVPVNRTRLLFVKYASLVIGAFIGLVVVAGTGLLVGGVLFGLGPATLLSGNQVGLANALGRLGVVLVFLTIGLAGLAAIGLFISTLTEQPIAAMIALTVVSTAMWILNGIPQLEWLQPWLLVHYWPSFADAFRDPMFLEQMRQGVLVALAYVVVFLGLAWARFSQKDITS
jgi:ABC-2 type transport system permease protein